MCQCSHNCTIIAVNEDIQMYICLVTNACGTPWTSSFKKLWILFLDKRNDIPSLLISSSNNKNIEYIYIQLNLQFSCYLYKTDSFHISKPIISIFTSYTMFYLLPLLFISQCIPFKFFSYKKELHRNLSFYKANKLIFKYLFFIVKNLHEI
jgi:hypothetical protein